MDKGIRPKLSEIIHSTQGYIKVIKHYYYTLLPIIHCILTILCIDLLYKDIETLLKL